MEEQDHEVHLLEDEDIENQEWEDGQIFGQGDIHDQDFIEVSDEESEDEQEESFERWNGMVWEFDSDEVTDDMMRIEDDDNNGESHVIRLTNLKSAHRRKLTKEEETALLMNTSEATARLPSPDRHGFNHPADEEYDARFVQEFDNQINARYEETEEQRKNRMEVSSSADGLPFPAKYNLDFTLKSVKLCMEGETKKNVNVMEWNRIGRLSLTLIKRIYKCVYIFFIA